MYLDIEIIIKRIRFPYLYTKIFITHNVTEICPCAVLTHVVIQNNLGKRDFGGQIWGPDHPL